MILGCQPDSPGETKEDVLRLELGELPTKYGKYFAKLADLLPRYYAILGIDYQGSEPPWKTALVELVTKKRKLSVNVHSIVDKAVVYMEKSIQKRLVTHSASPSNTLFMPINLLIGLLRAVPESGGDSEACDPRNASCQFFKQVLKRFVKDHRMCIETQKRTQPSTDYYRFYVGLVDYLKVYLKTEEKPARAHAMEFLDTYILPIYMATVAPSIATYRWTTKPGDYYPPDLIVIEEFIANGPPPNLDDPQRPICVGLFKRFYEYAKSFWDNKVVIDFVHPSFTREVYSTIKSITTDIRHLR